MKLTRWVSIGALLLLIAAGCTSADRDTSANPVPTSATVANESGDDNQAHAACVGQEPTDRPAAALVFATATCVNDLFDDEERVCAAARAANLSNLPVVIEDRLVTARPSLAISAAQVRAYVSVAAADTVAADIDGLGIDATVVPAAVSFEVDLLTADGTSTMAQLQGFPLIVTNWSAAAAQHRLADVTPPGDGEFLVSSTISEIVELQFGQSYTMFGPLGEEIFEYAGSFTTSFPEQFVLGFSDDDALRFLADGLGYDSLSVWSNDEAALVAIEELVAESPDLIASRPADELLEQLTVGTQQMRDWLAIVMCMAPNARVELATLLAGRTTTLATADCLLQEMATGPLAQGDFVDTAC